jgi:hypothetical protein
MLLLQLGHVLGQGLYCGLELGFLKFQVLVGDGNFLFFLEDSLVGFLELLSLDLVVAFVI